MKKLFVFLFIIAGLLKSNAQSRRIDSLLNLLKTYAADTNKVKSLNNLSFEYRKIGEPDKSIAYCKQALELAQKIDFKKGIANSYQLIGAVFKMKDNYPEALKNYFAALKIFEKINDKQGIAYVYNKIGTTYQAQSNYSGALKKYEASLKIFEEIKDKEGIAQSYNGIGNIYAQQGNYPVAIKNFFATLKIWEELKDKWFIAGSYNNIGATYYYQGNLEEALKNYSTALKIEEEIKDKQGVADSYNNIALIYNDKGNYAEALKMQLASLKMIEEIGDKNGIAIAYTNIGIIYHKQGNYAEALKMQLASLKMQEEIGDKDGMISCFINLGKVYTSLNRTKEAEAYLNKGLILSREIDIKDRIKETYAALSILDSTIGNYKAAFADHKMEIAYRDSLNNEETKKKTIQNAMQYEFDKKELATKAEQDKLDAINAEEKQKQRIYSILVSLVLLLVAVFSFFLYHRFKITQKQKHIIELQKDEVSRQKGIVEEKQSQILDSIHYAKHIQQSILADENEIKTSLKDFFVLYLPKDIVSGDFYWFTRKGADLFFATVDCTGHGVPGAFLTMVGSTLLSEIVNLQNITDPYAIIEALGEGVTNTLANKKDKSDAFADGMDISICKINLETRKLYFASANHAAYVVDETGLKQLDPQVKSVHGVFALSSKKGVSTKEVLLTPGTMIYMSTDGYPDQIGEESKKKLMAPRFKEMLSKAYKLPIEEQKALLEQTITEWKGNRKQNDDILVMGLRIS